MPHGENFCLTPPYTFPNLQAAAENVGCRILDGNIRAAAWQLDQHRRLLDMWFRDGHVAREEVSSLTCKRGVGLALWSQALLGADILPREWVRIVGAFFSFLFACGRL
ncbi:hypothetical protein GGTG_14132 [Gaeumannomyces tritici R3-111a-1]|uniref:Uncharacterized protein n=1 Tax=Gaeumannomyces tritici (strain R3-111a-1) TaxID=644352 RepID=J3PKR6_GAET3|nr:hypothetical protein GGTG_14132 [Gaeumannomyces tritici R3-111a-1]EJT68286.1 hypothetical protein GGTG_14132 [Gaeumannomyces tritici R3-111a-1]